MTKTPREIADGVWFLRTLMVNLYIVRTERSWVLVDTGLPGYAPAIRKAAAEVLGTSQPPAAIVLTHGHFDHVGSLQALLDGWAVPVYAHVLEGPYLTGRSAYPPPDPLAGGGAMSLVSRLYPRGPIDVSDRLHVLPGGGHVPHLDGWRWIATPGHSPGHVSLFRDSDRTLISGDAAITVQQESVLAVATQRLEMHGPPAYFTADWGAAGDSVGHLAALSAELLAPGHGEPLGGEAMREGLRALAAHFADQEVPSIGRYALQPAITDESGIVSLPPDPLPKLAAGVAIAAGLTYALALRRRGAARV